MFDTGALSSVLSGIQSQQPAPIVPAPATTTQTGPLANLQAILSGDANYGSIIRQIGGGMANMGPTGGDPYLAFAQGFGGTQTYATAQEKEAADRAAALQKQQMDANLALQRLTQDQSQHSATLQQNQSQFDARTSQDQSQFDARMTLEEAAEKRRQMVDDAQIKKTEREIQQLERKSGLTTSQVIEIERVAQASAENELDPAKRKQVIDETRDRLTKQVQSQDLSMGPGITAADSTTTSIPKVGDVVDGYQFTGGDPSDPASWKIQ